VSGLVSVITPAWGRPESIRATVDHVRAQSYRPLEHLVVVDGPMTPEYEAVAWDLREHSDPREGYSLRFISLGWRPTEELPDSFAVGALMTGALMARGEYQTWWCDDERGATDHLEALVGLLEAEGVDFVYPRVYCWKPGDPDGGITIGGPRPRFGEVTVALYRRSCLARGMYRFRMPRRTNAPLTPHDWDLFSQWVEGGASWAFLDRATFSHRVDH
jgi:glycosyltransferase involved in cell wall biosynthesis